MPGYLEEVLADAPAGFWRLNDSVAGVFADSSGHGHDATTYNTPTLGQAALTTYPGDAAVNFNGSYAIAPTSTDFNTANQLTLEAWIKTTANDSNERELIARDTDNTNRSALLAIQNGVAHLLVIIGGGTVANLAGTVNIHDGVAHHVVGTYDGANMKLYVDGALDTSQARTGNMNSPINAAVTIASRRTGSNVFTSPSSANLADIAFYTTALSATRILAHYTAGTAAYTSAPAAVTTARTARGLSATASLTLVATAAGTLSRASRGFTTTATPIKSVSVTLARGARGLTATRTLIYLATPWTADVSQSFTRGARGLTAVVTGNPTTVAPPAAKTPKFIKRVSHVMPAPTLDAMGRPEAGWAPSSTMREDVGRWRVVINGVDVSYFREADVIVSELHDAEPFGDSVAVLEFPQVSPFEAVGVGDLAWLVDDANVDISLVDSLGVETGVWLGLIASQDAGHDEQSQSLVITCQGALYQADRDLHQPPFYIDSPLDIGQLIARELNALVSRRYGTLVEQGTGITSRQRGDRSQTRIEYVQQLLGTATATDGRQLAVKQNRGTRTYYINWKATDVSATYSVGTPGLKVKLTRDPTQSPNAIYGEWTTPNGGRGRNSKYPNLLPDDAPAYPFTNPADVITVGVTDAGTDSGDGVTTWQRRMQTLGYTVSVTGTYSSADAAQCRLEQAAAGITVDGVVGPQTWAATFDVGANGGDLSGAYFAPIAELPAVEPYLYTASGAISGPNPAYDASKVRQSRFESMGAGITRDQALASAAAELARDSDPGWLGTLEATTDPEEKSRFFVRAGDNIKLKNFRGGDLVLHVAERRVDPSNLVVTWTVDTKARDALALFEIIERNRDTAADPARQYRKPTKSTTVADDAVTWDDEAGSGVVPRFALFGGLWSVIRIPMAEYGSIVRTTIQTESPARAFALLAFDSPVVANDLRDNVGNPLDSTNQWYTDVADWLDAAGMRMAWGQGDQPAGYSPGSYSDGDPVTGLLDDTASWDFASTKPPWVWLAFYSGSSCFVSGKFEQGVSA